MAGAGLLMATTLNMEETLNPVFVNLKPEYMKVRLQCQLKNALSGNYFFLTFLALLFLVCSERSCDRRGAIIG